MESSGQKPRLLYLGYAFPPGIANQFPEAQPAGHWIETSLVRSVEPWFDTRSVGISWIDVDKVRTRDNSAGLPNALNLLDKKPALAHRLLSLFRLRRTYSEWVGTGWRPDVVMVCNAACPVYNAFMRWLKRRPSPPPSVLYLADSVLLQRPLSWTRRLRYRLKPMKWTDAEMIPFYNACVAVSRGTEGFFARRNLPWLWLPNGVDPARALRAADKGATEAPLQLGYFGTLAEHGGIPAFLRIFTAKDRSAVLNICGYGKARTALADRYAQYPKVRFHPPRTPDECVRFAGDCDLMLNPRPMVAGNENNFSSKVFEYALSGKAILTSRVSGVDAILGEQAFYFDAGDFDSSLAEALDLVLEVPRAELQRRGLAIQRRVLDEFSWQRQGDRLHCFISQVLAPL